MLLTTSQSLPLKRLQPDSGVDEQLATKFASLDTEVALDAAIGFLDSQRLRGSGAPLAALLAAPMPSIPSEHGMLDRSQLEALMGVRYTTHLLFEREADFERMHLWSMPPPCSPARPFGSIPHAAKLGCAEQLRVGAVGPQLIIRTVGVVGGVECGLGLFASAPISSGTFLCEYTGLVVCDPPPERDDYAFALPVCDPDVRISARRYGNVCRLLNHSDRPNVALRTVEMDGLLHLVAITTAEVRSGEQLTVDYGPPYWRAHGRTKVAL